MVQLRYGTYPHDDNEVTVTIQKSVLETDGGVPYGQRETWDIEGILHGTDTADVISRLNALVLAYSVWYYDLTLTDANGVVCHQLVNAGSLTGVKITRPPSFPRGGGAELSTFRSYSIQATADYPSLAVPGGTLLRSFQEVVSFSGGGPRRAVLDTTNGPPVEQILYARTAYRATQQGTAVGLYGYPPIPAPLWPGSLTEYPDVSRASARLQNGQYTDFPVSWSYQFASAINMFGGPNQWVL